jgi:hypothetical protein
MNILHDVLLAKLRSWQGQIFVLEYLP